MKITGHIEAQKLLFSADREKSQSFLLEGSAGIGKSGIANLFAAEVLGCDISRVLSGAHPDFLIIERRVDEKTGKRKQQIVVEDARKLADFLSLTPAEGSHRVAIIDAADELNTAAANAILKVVEEPPKRAIIILLSHGKHILPTIRSRCVCVKLKPLADEEMKEVLADIIEDANPTDLNILSKIAQGSPGLAQKLHQNGGVEMVKSLQDLIGHFPQTNYPQIMKLAASIEGKSEGWEIYKTIFSQILFDIAKHAALEHQAGAGNVIDFEQAWHKRIAETETFNLDKKQIIENDLVGLAKCFG